jgi:mitogen-activated protein kinase 1/3
LSPKVVDLLRNLLQINSDKRLTSQGALEHPAMSRYHDEDDEPIGVEFSDPFESEINSTESSLRSKH